MNRIFLACVFLAPLAWMESAQAEPSKIWAAKLAPSGNVESYDELSSTAVAGGWSTTPFFSGRAAYVLQLDQGKSAAVSAFGVVNTARDVSVAAYVYDADSANGKGKLVASDTGFSGRPFDSPIALIRFTSEADGSLYLVEVRAQAQQLRGFKIR